MSDGLILFCDGSSKGNPGPASVGVSGQKSSGEEVFTISERIGTATNNVAEWTALIKALQKAQERGEKNIKIRMDSELVVKQMKGEYKVKNKDMMELKAKAVALREFFLNFEIRYIPREQNSRADALANLAQKQNNES